MENMYTQLIEVFCLGSIIKNVDKLLLCFMTDSVIHFGHQILVWLEAGVYGPSVIQNSILNGGHYNRSLDAQKLLAESMQRLLYKEFFLENGVTPYSDVVDILKEMKESTAAGNEKKQTFPGSLQHICLKTYPRIEEI